MKKIFLLLLLIPFLLVSCEEPEPPNTDDLPYITVDYLFNDVGVSVYSRRLAISNDNNSVYYTGEPTAGFKNHIYRRPLSYENNLEQMTADDNKRSNPYAMDLGIDNKVYYHTLNTIGKDSVVNVIMRAEEFMNLYDPEPQEIITFDGSLVGFNEYKGRVADNISVSADGLVFIIGWSETGYYYMNFRDSEPNIIALPNIADAVLSPDGMKYVFMDGSLNIYLTSTLLEEPYLIGSGRYPSISSNGKIAWIQDKLLFLYDQATEDIVKYNPPKNVTSADEMMNATLSEDGNHIAFRSYDYANSDIVFCSIP